MSFLSSFPSSSVSGDASYRASRRPRSSRPASFCLFAAALALGCGVTRVDAALINFEFDVTLTSNFFTPEMDDIALGFGVDSRFGSLALGSVFKAIAQIDLDERYLTEENFSDAEPADFSWSAMDGDGIFASGHDSVSFLDKTDGVFSFFGEGWSSYGFGFSLNTSNWQGSFGIQGGEAYDWYPSLSGAIDTAKIDGYTVPVADGGGTLMLLALAMVAGSVARLRWKRTA